LTWRDVRNAIPLFCKMVRILLSLSLARLISMSRDSPAKYRVTISVSEMRCRRMVPITHLSS
jgi:hypothetical protein